MIQKRYIPVVLLTVLMVSDSISAMAPLKRAWNQLLLSPGSAYRSLFRNPGSSDGLRKFSTSGNNSSTSRPAVTGSVGSSIMTSWVPSWVSRFFSSSGGSPSLGLSSSTSGMVRSLATTNLLFPTGNLMGALKRPISFSTDEKGKEADRLLEYFELKPDEIKKMSNKEAIFNKLREARDKMAHQMKGDNGDVSAELNDNYNQLKKLVENANVSSFADLLRNKQDEKRLTFDFERYKEFTAESSPEKIEYQEAFIKDIEENLSKYPENYFDQNITDSIKDIINQEVKTKDFSWVVFVLQGIDSSQYKIKDRENIDSLKQTALKVSGLSDRISDIMQRLHEGNNVVLRITGLAYKDKEVNTTQKLKEYVEKLLEKVRPSLYDSLTNFQNVHSEEARRKNFSIATYERDLKTIDKYRELFDAYYEMMKRKQEGKNLLGSDSKLGLPGK